MTSLEQSMMMMGVSPEELRRMCRAHGVSSRLSDSENEDDNEEEIEAMLERNKPAPQILQEDVELLKQMQQEEAQRDEVAVPAVSSRVNYANAVKLQTSTNLVSSNSHNIGLRSSVWPNKSVVRKVEQTPKSKPKPEIQMYKAAPPHKVLPMVLPSIPSTNSVQPHKNNGSHIPPPRFRLNIPPNSINRQYYPQQPPQPQNFYFNCFNYNQNYLNPQVNPHYAPPPSSFGSMPQASQMMQVPFLLSQGVGVQIPNYVPDHLIRFPNQNLYSFINPRQRAPGPIHWKPLQNLQNQVPKQNQHLVQHPPHPRPPAEIPKKTIQVPIPHMPYKDVIIPAPQTEIQGGSALGALNKKIVTNDTHKKDMHVDIMPTSSQSKSNANNDFVLSKKTTKARESTVEDNVIGRNSFSLLAPSSESECSDIENAPLEDNAEETQGTQAKPSTALPDKISKRKKKRTRTKRNRKAKDKHIDLAETQERFVLKDKKNNTELEEPDYDDDFDLPDLDEFDVVPKWWIDRKIRILKGKRGMDRFIPVTEVCETVHIREDILEKMIKDLDHLDHLQQCRERVLSSIR